MVKRKKAFLIATFIIIAAIIIVICVNLLTSNEPIEFEGTLVESQMLEGECIVT